MDSPRRRDRPARRRGSGHGRQRPGRRPGAGSPTPSPASGRAASAPPSTITNLGDPVTAWTLAFAFPPARPSPSSGTAPSASPAPRSPSRNAGLQRRAAPRTRPPRSASTARGPAATRCPPAFTLNGAACTGARPTTTRHHAPPPRHTPDTRHHRTHHRRPRRRPAHRSRSWRWATRSPARPAAGARCSGRNCSRPDTEVDFVGTLPPQGCGFTYDGENEGHGGFLATNVASQNQLVGWLAATDPDVVLMHFGTNDVWSNIAARDDPGGVHHAGRPDAGHQPADEDPGRADHPDEPEHLRRVRPAGDRPQRRHPGLGRRH